MKKLKISPEAAYIFRGGLMVSNALLLSAALILRAALPFDGSAHQFFALSQSLMSACAAVLFFTVFASAFVEDKSR